MNTKPARWWRVKITVYRETGESVRQWDVQAATREAARATGVVLASQHEPQLLSPTAQFRITAHPRVRVHES